MTIQAATIAKVLNDSEMYEGEFISASDTVWIITEGGLVWQVKDVEAWVAEISFLVATQKWNSY